MKKTVLITGASSGIGKATALYFASQGWNVAATMRSPEKETGLSSIQNLKLYRLDVTDTASIETAIQHAIADFGQIDALVNNAGFGADGVFETMSDDFIRNQFDTNVFGLMRVTRAIIPYFRAQKSGSIIQVASMGGRLAFPLYSIYHGTKWAVEGFSEALQYELAAFNIQVKIIEPGAIKTEFYGRSRAFVGMDFEPYKAFAAKVEKVGQDAGAKGEKPEVVAQTIFKAATDGSSKMRYPTGAPAPMLLLLRKLIPDSWWFGIVKMSYKL
jgi:NAD(P)-dependent dehydrogenase (short-subunit alcohol dehydrogenase family)